MAASAFLIFAVAEIRLTYFPVAGRGELARLYAAAGGLDIVDDSDVVLGGDYKKTTPFGFLPVLDHPEAGLVRLQESLAVERYIASLAPRFETLTPQQRAVDDQFACAKEDMMAVEPCAANATIARACVPALMERHLGILEGLVPENGFVHGLAFPTGADLVVLLVAEAGFPWGRAMRLAGYHEGWRGRFPKVHALAQRTAAVPEVAAYLGRSATFYARRDPPQSELAAPSEAPGEDGRAGFLPPIPAWTHSTAAVIVAGAVAAVAIIESGAACRQQRRMAAIAEQSDFRYTVHVQQGVNM